MQVKGREYLTSKLYTTPEWKACLSVLWKMTVLGRDRVSKSLTAAWYIYIMSIHLETPKGVDGDDEWSGLLR